MGLSGLGARARAGVRGARGLVRGLRRLVSAGIGTVTPVGRSVVVITVLAWAVHRWLGWLEFGVVAAVLTTVAALVTAAYGGAMGTRAAAAVPVEETGGCGHSCISCSLKDACQPS